MSGGGGGSSCIFSSTHITCTLSSLGRRFVFVNELEVVQSNSKLAVEHMCETLLAAVLCVDELRNGFFFLKL